MKRLGALFFCLSFLSIPILTAGTLTQDLATRIKDAESDSFIPVIVVMADRQDRVLFQGAPRSDRDKEKR